MEADDLRKIIHVDMDAFYASVEQRDAPELRGRPVAVGGSSRRGVVAAASYEARKYGIHSAMPSVTAKRRCPELVFVKPRFEVYKQISGDIRSIFHRYTDLVEPLSLDEAYLDVTAPRAGPPSATLIARAVKREIFEETGLTASAGVSFNKFLAKVASGFQKPDGLTVVKPSEARAFIAALPIEKFFGVGPATARRFHAMGIRTGADLQTRDQAELVRRFGKSGAYYYRVASGRDDRPVRSSRRRKSLGAERTFGDDAVELETLRGRLEEVVDRVSDRMGRAGVRGRTVTLKIKYHDFQIQTRSRTLTRSIGRRTELLEVARALLESEPPARAVRLLGVSLSSLDDPEASVQLPIWSEPEEASGIAAEAEPPADPPAS